MLANSLIGAHASQAEPVAFAIRLPARRGDAPPRYDVATGDVGRDDVRVETMRATVRDLSAADRRTAPTGALLLCTVSPDECEAKGVDPTQIDGIAARGARFVVVKRRIMRTRGRISLIELYLAGTPGF